jgi:two-component system sensor kinase FixL
MRAVADKSALEVQALLDATVDAVIIIDDRGRIETFNRAAERLFGYRSHEVLGRSVNVLMTEPDRTLHDDYMSRYHATDIPHIIGIGREIDAQRKDGSVFPAFLSVGKIAGGARPRYVGFLHDITLRRESLAALQRERDRVQLYLDVAEVILLALDADLRITLINRKGCATLEWREDELVGQSWLEVAVPAAERRAAEAELLALLEGSSTDARSFEHGICNRGGARRLIVWRAIALRDAGGPAAGLLCSGEDITEARNAHNEAQRAQERMTHVARLATMGEMAAGIAHELNQPLAAIASYAQASERLLGVPAPDVAEVQDAMRQIAAQALRAGEIIRRLRNLVRNRETLREPTDVNELIRELLTLTQADTRMHGLRLELELEPALPAVALDRIQMQQVLLNLVHNAIEALESEPRAERRILIRTASAGECEIEISVTDGGPGVHLEIADRMFDPFTTTKATGTGLGLAISRTIVQAHRGKLGYRPVQPGGACFYVRLPISVEDPA